MLQYINQLFPKLQDYPWLEPIIALAILAIIALIVGYIANNLILKSVVTLYTKALQKNENLLIKHKVISKVVTIIPTLIIYLGVYTIPNLSAGVVKTITILCQVYLLLLIPRITSAILHIANELYQKKHPDSQRKPIKGFLQLIIILSYVVTFLLILGTLLQRDIFTLLAGLGAMAAVMMLIFQTTILSFVASIQLSSYDMIHIGDWIEMPALNADGFVTDISLHTVTVQNWDKTITVIPSSRFLTDTFRNWRGMWEAGGRRIKRSILLDQNSIHFLNTQEIEHLKSFALINDYLTNKKLEIGEWNNSLSEKGYTEEVNQRRLTNLGTFRAYIDQYIKNNPLINQEMIMLVRPLEPTAQGIPLEIYCFTTDTAWVAHESVQADIFDHLLAILPEFGLRVFQQPSGADFKSVFKS